MFLFFCRSSSVTFHTEESFQRVAGEPGGGRPDLLLHASLLPHQEPLLRPLALRRLPLQVQRLLQVRQHVLLRLPAGCDQSGQDAVRVEAGLYQATPHLVRCQGGGCTCVDHSRHLQHALLRLQAGLHEEQQEQMFPGSEGIHGGSKRSQIRSLLHPLPVWLCVALRRHSCLLHHGWFWHSAHPPVGEVPPPTYTGIAGHCILPVLGSVSLSAACEDGGQQERCAEDLAAFSNWVCLLQQLH